MTSLAPAAAAAASQSDLGVFGHDPWWITIPKIVLVFVFLVLVTLFTIWAERRVIGRMQNRPGPNRAGPFGLLQSLADGVKLALKEDIIPEGVDRVVYILAPIMSAIPAFISFGIIPFGPTVSVFGHRTPLQLSDLPVAVLLVLAMSSMGVYGIVLAGWASRSPFAVLGGMRSSAQVISYEIAMGLSFVAVFLYASSLSTSQIVNAQSHLWFALPLCVSFAVYLITMVGETNRLPFDLPEGEGELVGGFHTEYSSLKFALFYLAEYINMATVSALSITLFLGGWRAPWPISLWTGANHGWWPVLWFVAKLLVMLFVFVWLRGSLPRVRYDQLMKLGWKVLIPLSIVWILLVATLRGLADQGEPRSVRMIVAAAMIVVVLAIYTAFDLARERRNKAEREREEAHRMASEADPAFGGFPVPPLDAPHYRARSSRARAGATTEGAPRAVAPNRDDDDKKKEVTGA